MRSGADERTSGGLPGDADKRGDRAVAAGGIGRSDVEPAEEMTIDTACLTRPSTVAKVAVFVRSPAHSSCVEITNPASTTAPPWPVETAAMPGVASSSVAQWY